MADAKPTGLLEDAVVGAMLPTRGARGRLVRLTHVLDAILAPHNYPPVIEKLLADALALTALLGSLLKDEKGQITMQAQTESGVVDLLVCDYLAGQLRGHVKYDGDRLAEAGPAPTLFQLFGKGYLAITFDQPSRKERYQGIAPIEGEDIGEVAQSYFAQSEQIPSLVRVAAEKRDGHWVAGGLMFQHLPEGEEGRDRLHTKLDHPDWPHVAILAGSVKAGELTDPTLALDALLWRLFHEEDEVRLLASTALTKGCRCSPDYIKSVIARFPPEEQAHMVADDGFIRVDCAFCATSFPIAPAAPGAAPDGATDERGDDAV
ncbi:Hsp33 family molecular chaperone HslO [Sphingomicrobium astaxanthinifaciens]|uniref:Hsp33 family molecular chaperone HslO n=1 Tax=Sphingomicrobium astaxanthinifaciens TaxID=1227949 RepID=UPI001FCAA9BD|nr:Hsp33 family molecular chaperone HslO [Sphingomicrobium astaxanthinifaciens]MCJ7422037.1 Hsp33 family molecular chaperone HslO [Sphingomicrobium astaxanthinifaciens]